MVSCKICGAASDPIFKALILTRYDVQYYQCPSCEFIQTETPYWLSEAYASAITSQDIGLLSRNRMILPLLKTLIKIFYNKNKRFLDYGGGYGILVRSMRDQGYDMFLSDKFCTNLFAAGFEDDGSINYELITAFEVFEHLENPLDELKKILLLGNDLFISTELQPHKHILPDNWWYIMPETGQHIALYSLRTLQVLAEKYNMNLYSNGTNLHLFTKKNHNRLLFSIALRLKVAKILDWILPDPPGKLQDDYSLAVKNASKL